MAVRNRSWQTIRQEAAHFAKRWADGGYEKGESQPFYVDLFRSVFGLSALKKGAFERPIKGADGRTRYIDYLWPGTLIIEQKSKGKDLDQAQQQAMEYVHALPDHEQPRYCLVSDFQRFRLHDLELDRRVEFDLTNFHETVNNLRFLVGEHERDFTVEQDPVNKQAAISMGEFRDSLAESNYNSAHLDEYLVRVMFTLFADDTGIWNRDAVQRILLNRAAEDGSTTGQWMHQIHETLGLDEDARQTNLDEDLAQLPYVAGLFDSKRRGQLATAMYSEKMHRILLKACAYDWEKVSPIVFGAMFESAMDADKRRNLGAHYTSEKNIAKVIEPLFMDDLANEFLQANSRRGDVRVRELEAFHAKLGKLKFLDPACGCGNFLIVAYREVRKLEMEVIRARKEAMGNAGQREMPIQSAVDVNQFHGIELNPFAAKIAEAGLWMMDHIMNDRLNREFSDSNYVRIPIRQQPNIWCADALELDWGKVLPAEQCDFVMGNPPFVGNSEQDAEQRKQMARIMGGKSGKLDYVACWFVKGGEYIRNGGGKCALVATNSICQGEQAATLWPTVLQPNNLALSFAHQTFSWKESGGDERGKTAAVHVIIAGMEPDDTLRQCRLFSSGELGTQETNVRAITPYLTDGSFLRNPNAVVARTPAPINGLPSMTKGTMPLDDGQFILDPEERDALIKSCPTAAEYIAPFVGSREFLQGGNRSILCLRDAPSSLLNRAPIRRRLDAIREFRAKSKSPSFRAYADRPNEFHYDQRPKHQFLLIPRVSSSRREYVPIGYVDPPTVPSDAVYQVAGASKGEFALLTSKMHNAWTKVVAGRMKSDIRYSGVVYNNFPTPPGGRAALAKLEPHADRILAARDEAQAKDPTLSLGDMYNPTTMPLKLRKAHEALDKAVDRMYRSTPLPRRFSTFRTFASRVRQDRRTHDRPEIREGCQQGCHQAQTS